MTFCHYRKDFNHNKNMIINMIGKSSLIYDKICLIFFSHLSSVINDFYFFAFDNSCAIQPPMKLTVNGDFPMQATASGKIHIPEWAFNFKNECMYI